MQKMKELTAQEAFNKAAACCSRAECCTADISKKLERWGLDADAREEVIGRLVGERFIDERRYCHSFVRDKFRYNQWGRTKIAQALRLKGVPEDCAREALEGIEEEEYRATLGKLLQAKSRGLKAASDYERRGKLIRFALGRGFEMETIKHCLHADDEDFA